MTINVRPVMHNDAEAIAYVVRALGFDRAPEEIDRRLALAPDRASDPALIAEEAGRALGLIALHIAPMLFYPKPLARITTLVVDPGHRRRGIGRRLVEAAAAVASDADCDRLELTTGLHREDAHAFYESLDFRRAAFGMVRPIA